MADELPKDTKTIKSLTPEQAKKLVAEFNGGLGLDGVTTVTPEVAKALSELKGRLSLGSKLFAAFGGRLPLTLQAAKLISACREEADISLDAVTVLDTPDSVAIAKTLAMRTGPLSLPNLKKISPRAIAALVEKEDVRIPRIDSLELIPEPDGSITEDDFVIPDGFEKRQQLQRRKQQ